MPLRHVHAGDVLGAGLAAHQDDLLARAGDLDGLLGAEDDLALGRARRCGQAGGHDVDLGVRIDLVMQHLVQVVGLDQQQRTCSEVTRPSASISAATRMAAHAGALAVARLQHPQTAFLNRELDVLHVLVVLFELLADGAELGVGTRA